MRCYPTAVIKPIALPSRKNDDNVTDDYQCIILPKLPGRKTGNRFNAYSYWYLTKAMDSHNVGRSRHGVEKALSLIKASTLVIGIKSDVLFPIEEQQYLFRHIPKVSFCRTGFVLWA